MYLISNCNSSIRNIIEQERWCVLYTKPNFEKRVARKLKEFGFISYLPLQKQLRYWSDRKSWVETPLFRSYVFVKTSIKKKDLVFKVDGILNYVKNGRNLAILSEPEIDRIEQLCLYTGKIEIEFEKFEAGKLIEISRGVLKGLKGFLTDVSDNKKIRVYIKGLNCFASVTIDLDSVSLKYI